MAFTVARRGVYLPLLGRLTEGMHTTCNNFSLFISTEHHSCRQTY
jgi:hypothetical protein